MHVSIVVLPFLFIRYTNNSYSGAYIFNIHIFTCWVGSCIQDELGRYSRSISTGPLLPWEQQSWVRCLEEKLLGVYAAIMSSRISDIILSQGSPLPRVNRRSSSRVLAWLPDTSNVPSHTDGDTQTMTSWLGRRFINSSIKILSTTGTRSKLLLWVEVLSGSSSLLTRVGGGFPP
jgi:hypothetical protein